MEDNGLEVNLNGENFVLTRYNTTLYTFWGRVILRDYELDASNFDHLFLRTSEEDDEQVKGGYLFRHHPAFEGISKFAIENSFPAITDMTYIPECDVRAFEDSAFGDLVKTDTVPEEWEQ